VSRARRRIVIPVAVIAAGLGVAGCGDDDSGDTTPSISIPTVTAPTAPTTTTPATPTTGGSAPGATTTQGGGRYNPSVPDSPENDVPPPPGSPQEAFEKQCEENPAACG
jgi:hypothetical protein